MFILQWMVLSLASFAVATVSLKENRWDDRINHPESKIDDVSIQKFVNWAIFNNQITRFGNYIRIYQNANLNDFSVEGKEGKRVTANGTWKLLENWGTVQMHSTRSTTGFLYDMSMIQFYNKGRLFLGGDGSVEPPKAKIAAPYWYNWGLVSLYQNKGAQGNCYFGAKSKYVNNHGSICLHNFQYHQETALMGNGCLRVNKDSILNIQNHNLPIFTEQTIALEHPTAAIKVANHKAPTPYTVAGFGGGNWIISEVTIDQFHYDGSTGNLIIYLDSAKKNFVKFSIGKGYINSDFEITTSNVAGSNRKDSGIRYNGEVPASANKVPSRCPPCDDLPMIPYYSQNPDEYFATD
ncbi:hypothetical protein DICA3_C16534 [Diutina catenulata]